MPVVTYMANEGHFENLTTLLTEIKGIITTKLERNRSANTLNRTDFYLLRSAEDKAKGKLSSDRDTKSEMKKKFQEIRIKLFPLPDDVVEENLKYLKEYKNFNI